jgi:hypothetical protein
MRFFTGLHQPSDAKHFGAAFISVNRLRTRKSPMTAGDWIMDSGAFTEISTHGHYRHSVCEYAAEIRRWATNGSGNLLAAVAQDWMCEPFIIVKTGLSVAEHQRLTIERYDALRAEDTSGVYILPVLQGFEPADYVRHVEAYGARLTHGAWVGVGSVCKRNGTPESVAAVLHAIKSVRPDLRLHGFGLKTTALAHPLVHALLHTADSMAWSYAARKQGGNANDWREAVLWTSRITSRPTQQLLDLLKTCVDIFKSQSHSLFEHYAGKFIGKLQQTCQLGLITFWWGYVGPQTELSDFIVIGRNDLESEAAIDAFSHADAVPKILFYVVNVVLGFHWRLSKNLESTTSKGGSQ